MPTKRQSSRPSLSGKEAAHFKALAEKAAAVLGKQNITIDIAATKKGVKLTVSAELPRQLPAPAPAALPPTEFRAGLYEHYKGGFYQALGVAAHSESDELLVVYIALDVSKPGMRMRVRPMSMWKDMVMLDGLWRPRFKYVGLALPPP